MINRESGRVQPSSTVTGIEPFTMPIIISTCIYKDIKKYSKLLLSASMIVLLFPIDSQNVFNLYFLVLEIKIRFQVKKCNYTWRIPSFKEEI